MPGQKCIPDGLSTDLTSFSASHSFPLFVPLPHSTVSPGSSIYIFPSLSSLHVYLSLWLPCIIMPYFFPPHPLSLLCLPLLHSPFFPQLLYVTCLPMPPSHHALYHCLPCCFTPFLLFKMKLAHGEHDKQASFHWIPGVVVPSYVYQHGNAAF